MLMIPTLISVISGILLIFLKDINEAARKIYVSVALILTDITVITIFFSDTKTLTLLSLGENLSISFFSDGLSLIFAILFIAIFTVCGFFAFGYMEKEKDKNRFFGFYLIVLGVLLALTFSENIITMYLCFEFATLTSVPLVLHEMNKESIAAGLKYLFYSIAGAFMGLFGIFVLYSFPTLSGFVSGGSINESDGILLTGIFFMIIGFGTKAGMFPMHAWLSAAHPVAPAPASAVLSGIIAKAGIFAVIRTIYYTVGINNIKGTWVQYVWIILALITVFMGSMLAYKEKILKKRLAYSSVSQLSYIMLGLATLSPIGFTGAIMHTVFHAIIKSGLFITAGSIIHETGITKADELKGIGKRMPITIWCWTFLSLALIGIPPFCGFASKWYLASGALSADIGAFGWIVPAVLLISALLTAGYLLPITINGFFVGNDFDYKNLKKCEPKSIMIIPMIILAILSLFLGIFTEPIISFAEALL